MVRLVLPELDIDSHEGDPFDPQSGLDLFERREFAESLLNLVRRVEEPLVISLEAPWGEGKTTFIKMWKKHAELQGVRCIYFDAFAHDYVDDPFLALAGSLAKFAKKHSENKARGLLDAAARVGKHVLPFAGRTGFRLLTGIDVDGLQANKIVEEITKDGGKLVENTVREKLESYLDEASSAEAFKSQLKDIASYSDRKLPLVFIVDELDRCRPSFALETLERIKHMFSEANVIFLLAFNRRQIENYIKGSYGGDVEASMYLQKFIGISARLPSKVGEKLGNKDQYRVWCHYLHQSHGISGIHWEPLANFSRHFRISLRGVQKIFARLAILEATGAFSWMKISGYDSMLAAFLVTVRIAHHSAFERFAAAQISYAEAEAELSLGVMSPRQGIQSTLKKHLNASPDKLDFTNGVAMIPSDVIPGLCELIERFEGLEAPGARSGEGG